MRAKEFTAGKESKARFVEMFSKFLPLAMHYLQLKRLPKIVFQHSIADKDQPTFGRYVNDENTLYVALSNRHPVDILRTVAHELQHYKQDTEHKLHIDSGRTGSPEENEAHAMAGIVMRHFNKQYPEFLKDKPVIAENCFDRMSNRLFVKKLMSERDLIEHAKTFSKNLSLDGVPITSKNRYTVVCSTIAAHIKNSLNESKHITSGKQIVQLLKRLDQFAQMPIKVGSTVAIINSQLQGDSIELWGFTTPKKISKIYRDPSDKSIKQFEFNNDPDDVWPRTENAEYNGQFLMYSAFFGDKKSADHALTMITLNASGDLDIRNHVTEQSVGEDWSDKYKRSIDCSHPKGFSQRAHCQGRKKDENVDRDEMWYGGDNDPDGPRTRQDYSLTDKIDFEGLPASLIYRIRADANRIPSGVKGYQARVEFLNKYKDYLKKHIGENFADGRNPQDKGDSKRYGVPTKASVSTLRKVAKQGGRKGQLAHWMANMKAGRAKK